MENQRQIIDRFSVICPAGQKSVRNETVESLLKDYSEENLARSMVKQRDAGLEEKSSPYVIRPFYEESISKTLYETVSPFKEFECKFMEELNYKRHPLAKPRPGISKPPEVTNLSQTFGKLSEKSENLYDLILPRKKYDQVLRESQYKHEMYVRSHEDYNPSEQISRNYDRASFDPNATFGVVNSSDSSGAYVKRIMKSCIDPTDCCFLGLTEGDYKKRTKSRLATPSFKTGITCYLPPNITFGKPSPKDKYRAKCLMYNQEFDPEKLELYESIANINLLRRYLKKYQYFYNVRTELDENEVWETCSWNYFIEVLLRHHIPINERKLRIVFKYFNFIDDENNIKVKDALNLFDIFVPLPDMEKTDTKREFDPTILTTYQNQCQSIFEDDKNCEMFAAGEDFHAYPSLPSQYCSADRESLPTETNVKALLNPSIPTQFGLSHRDYLVPRSKQELQEIFSKADINLKDFEQIWSEATKVWTSQDDKVSVEALLFALDQIKRSY